MEIVRAKDDRFIGPFTLAQLTSTLLVIIGLVLLARWKDGPELPPGNHLTIENEPAPPKSLAAA